MDSYIFNGNTDTPESVARRRQVADALAARIFGQAPQNLGSGIAAIGQALIARQMGQEADASEAAGRQNANAAFAPILGGGPAPTPVASAAPVSAPGDAASAIAGIESGGAYDKLGPVTSSGDRAYGKYQVMGANIPEWTKTHLGQPMTPEQYLANPQAQDAVFNGQFGQYAQKYGPEGAAKAWFAGERGMNNPNAKDQLGTSVQAYADRFSKAYGQQPYQVAGPAVVAPGAAPTVAAVDPAAIPPNAQPAQGALPTAPQMAAQGMPQQPMQTAPATAGKPTMQQLAAAISNPWLSKGQQAVATALYQQRLKEGSHTQETDASGNIWDVSRDTGQKTLSLKKDPSFGAPYKDADGNLVQRDATGRITVLNQADKAPTSVSEYKFYRDNLGQGQEPMDYATWSTAKARAGASNISNNIDMNSGQTYDKQLAEGLGKSHASLANGVEDAKSRARDVAAMQGAIDQIQKNGGTTGGMGQSQMLELKKTINSGAAALGINTPFNENDISDKEFLTKFNRQMAGAQAKGAVGSRVTNFEMSNYLKANPGLDMSVTGNQRLLGIQAQIEQRNVAVGNAIREATAAAISGGKKIDPVTVQKIITQYDEEHHVQDPISGQDLTQSYTLPEFQGKGTNPSLAAGHEQNVSKIRRYNPATGAIE
jgi:hypothetical protein